MNLLIWLLVGLLLLLPAPTDATLTYETNPDFATYLPGFLPQLDAELAQNDVMLRPAHNNSHIRLSAIPECARGDCIYFRIWLHTPTELAASDVLMAQDTAPTFFLFSPPLDAAAQRQLVEAVAGLSLYSAGRCDLARPYLQPMPYKQDRFGWPYEVAPYSLPFYAGNCALLAGDYAAAAESFKAALIRNDGAGLLSSAPALNLIWTYLQTGQTQAAADLLYSDMLAQASDAEHPDILLRKAQLLALAFDYDAAIATINHAIDQAMNSIPLRRQELAALFVERGQLYLLLYEWDRVLHDYNAALRLVPGYPEAYYQRGLLYLSILQTGQQLRRAALSDFLHYLELAPDGEHAAAAQRYAASIRAELAAGGS